MRGARRRPGSPSTARSFGDALSGLGAHVSDTPEAYQAAGQSRADVSRGRRASGEVKGATFDAMAALDALFAALDARSPRTTAVRPGPVARRGGCPRARGARPVARARRAARARGRLRDRDPRGVERVSAARVAKLKATRAAGQPVEEDKQRAAKRARWAKMREENPGAVAERIKTMVADMNAGRLAKLAAKGAAKGGG